jgi:hypothetical protein
MFMNETNIGLHTYMLIYTGIEASAVIGDNRRPSGRNGLETCESF